MLAWVILGLFLVFIAIGLWLHWRAVKAEGKARRRRLEADLAQEDQRRAKDLQREEHRTPDEVLDEFEKRFGTRRID